MKAVFGMFVCMGVLGLSGIGQAEEGAANAQEKSPGSKFEKRIERQKRRIQHGVKKGKLTEEQAKSLEATVDKIKAEKDAATANGRQITKEEKENLHKELKDSSEAIRAMKHPEKPAPGH